MQVLRIHHDDDDDENLHVYHHFYGIYHHALFRLIASRLLRDFDVKLGLMFSLQG
jgi:hypothetical protein